MGKNCGATAAYEVRGLVPHLAVASHPVRLCKECLLKGEDAVDFFKWADSREVPGSRLTMVG